MDEDWEMSDNVLCEDIDIDEATWSEKLSKLSRSPIFGSFFGN